MIELGANDYNKIAYCAIDSGHKKIIDTMIAGFKDKDGNIVGADNYDKIAIDAAYGGYKDIVEDMIALGACSEELYFSYHADAILYFKEE